MLSLHWSWNSYVIRNLWYIVNMYLWIRDKGITRENLHNLQTGAINCTQFNCSRFRYIIMSAKFHELGVYRNGQFNSTNNAVIARRYSCELDKCTHKHISQCAPSGMRKFEISLCSIPRSFPYSDVLSACDAYSKHNNCCLWQIENNIPEDNSCVEDN